MSQLTASTIAAGSGDTGATVFANHEANIILVQTNFYDSADPGSPPNGQNWYHTGDGKMYMMIGGAKTAILCRYVLDATLNAQSNQISNLHLHNIATGSLPTPGAGTKSQVWWDSTLSMPGHTTATANYYFGGMNADASEMVAIPCSLNVAGAGTPATADVTTRLGGWLMDATAEELNFVALGPVPSGWTTADDCYLEVMCSLVAAETAADDIDMDAEILSSTPGSGDGTDNTTTSAVTANYDIGAAASQYDIHRFRITVDHDDATNPVAAGDYVSGYIQRNTVGGAGKVAGIVVHAITLMVPAFRYAYA